jgi:CDP-diglyceride synthetase
VTEPTAAVKPADPTHSNKIHTLIVRTITGLVMMFGFILIMFSNHAIISAFVVLLQIMVYREMTSLRYSEAKEKDIPFFRSLNWYVVRTCRSLLELRIGHSSTLTGTPSSFPLFLLPIDS